LRKVSSIICDVTQCSPVNGSRRFGGNYCPHLKRQQINKQETTFLLGAYFTLVYCLAYCSTLKMKAILSTENFVDFLRTTWRCVPEAKTLSSHCWENLRSNVLQEEFLYFVGFEILTAVLMDTSSFWVTTPCGLLKVDRCFGRTYRLHLQGCRISCLLQAGVCLAYS
jgi:hypothetical protein